MLYLHSPPLFQHRRLGIVLVCLMVGSTCLVPVTAIADKAYDMLGVKDIRPKVQEAINNSFLGDGLIAALREAVEDGDLTNEEAGHIILTQIDKRLEAILKRMDDATAKKGRLIVEQALGGVRAEFQTAWRSRIGIRKKDIKVPDLKLDIGLDEDLTLDPLDANEIADKVKINMPDIGTRLEMPDIRNKMRIKKLELDLSAIGPNVMAAIRTPDLGVNIGPLDIRKQIAIALNEDIILRRISLALKLDLQKLGLNVDIASKIDVDAIRKKLELDKLNVNIPDIAARVKAALDLSKLAVDLDEDLSLEDLDITSRIKLAIEEDILKKRIALDLSKMLIKMKSTMINMPDINQKVAMAIDLGIKDLSINMAPVTIDQKLAIALNLDAIQQKLGLALDLQLDKVGVNVGDIAAKVQAGLKNPKIGLDLDQDLALDLKLDKNLEEDIRAKINLKLDDDIIRRKIGLDMGMPDISQKMNIDARIDESKLGLDLSQDLIKQKLGLDMDGDIIKKKIGLDMEGDIIKKKIGLDMDGDIIKKKIGLKLDETALRNKLDLKLNIDALDPGKIRKRINDAVEAPLEDVRNKVKAGVASAFDKLGEMFQKQVTDQSSKYSEAKAKYDSINVPPITYRQRCKGIWIGSWCTWGRYNAEPNPDSVAANTKAQVEKNQANGEMQAAKEQLDKYTMTLGMILSQGGDVLAGIDAVFDDAITKMAETTGEAPDETVDTDNTVKPPRKLLGSSPLVGGDNVLEIGGDVSQSIVAVGQISAAIGSDSKSNLDVGNIGTESNTKLASIRQTILAPGVISAAIGYKSTSNVAIGNTNGTVQGSVDRFVTSPGIVSAAIGSSSTASVTAANLAGTVEGPAKQIVTLVGAVAASIGANTKATIGIGNADKNAVTGPLTQYITQLTPAVAAAIGYKSESNISVGQIKARVDGSVYQAITSGALISASIGGNTSSSIRIGEITKAVTGNVRQNIYTGAVLDVAVGGNTRTRTEIGVIDAPVRGNVDMDISTGAILNGTVGYDTSAETLIGGIYAPVYGSLNSNISTGAVSTFAIGIGGNDKSIYARTLIGNVFEPVYGNPNIDIHTAAIFSLGFGIVLDLGPFGTLDIRKNTCNTRVNIGNIGSPC